MTDFTADVAYTDPLGTARGFDGLDQFIGGAQQQFDGLVFSLNGAVDGHHDIARRHPRTHRPRRLAAQGFEGHHSFTSSMRRMSSRWEA